MEIKQIIIENEDYMMHGKIWSYDQIVQAPFAEDDVLTLLKNEETFKELISIRTFAVTKSQRGKGRGTNILKGFCELHPDRPVLYIAGLLLSEYPNEPTKEEMDQFFQRIDKFLIATGFISINDFVGYEESRAYIYNNDWGKLVRKKIDEYQASHNITEATQ